MEAANAELSQQAMDATAALDDAQYTKNDLESQIEALEDLKYTITDDNIIADIDAEISGMRDQITEADNVILGAMDAFNVIAEQQMVIEDQRIATETAYNKALALSNAAADLAWIEGRITEVEGRLEFFVGFEKKDDDDSLPPCEPEHIYYVDEKGIAQLTSEAIHYIPYHMQPGYDPAFDTTATAAFDATTGFFPGDEFAGPAAGAFDTAAGFTGVDGEFEDPNKEPFPGFNKQKWPGQEEEEGKQGNPGKGNKWGNEDEFDASAGFDNIVVPQHNGSLQEQLAWDMQMEVDHLLNNQAITVDKIMKDIMNS